MTEEKIYEMTVEAGKHADMAYARAWNDGEQHGSWQYFRDTKFAELIRSATKEEDARICDELWNRGAAIAEYCNKGNDNDWWVDAERWMKTAAENGTSECADAIRASK